MSAGKKDKVRILIVDDHPILRYGLRRLIDAEEDMAVCGEAANAADGFEAVGNLKPDMVIVDISMKGRSGIELVKDVHARHAGLPLLMLSVHEEATYAERALRAGARGYIMKQRAPKLIISAIREVMAGEVFVCDKMATKLLAGIAAPQSSVSDDSPVACLSDRELEVLEAIGRGQGTKQISEAFHLSVSTIETHRRHIKQKLKLNTASELARFAAEWLLSQK